MGEGAHDALVALFPPPRPVRVYAPVGTHRDLLAYLVRRLLENGANSSFVHQFSDPDVSAEQLAVDPRSVASAASAPGSDSSSCRRPNVSRMAGMSNARGMACRMRGWRVRW